MGRNAQSIETGHEKFGQAVVQHAFTFDDIFFLGIECRGIIFEILNQGAWLWTLIEDLCLAFINQLATCHVTLRALLASYGNVRRAASRHRRAHPLPTASFCRTAAPTIRSNFPARPGGQVLAGQGPKFYRQFFIIFMMKINFTHVLLSGMT